jgi:hypothetical protein
MNQLLFLALFLIASTPLGAQGPDGYLALVDALKDIDLNSKDGKEIVSKFDTLDASWRPSRMRALVIGAQALGASVPARAQFPIPRRFPLPWSVADHCSM